MTRPEQNNLDALIQIAREKPCPLDQYERRFVLSLDNVRDVPLTSRQGALFDALVKKHVIGESDVSETDDG